MPTYEYECGNCGHAFEEFQYMSDAPLKKCPSCKKNRLQRLIGSGAGIIFKGSGFYETDYKRKDQPKPAESNPSPKKESSSSSDASTSKPAKAS